MNKIALFLNHDKIGGAERSAMEQVSAIGPEHVDIFVPGDIAEFVKISENKKLFKKYRIPRALKELSQTGNSNYIKVFFSYSLAILGLFKITLGQYEKIWLNGTKAFVTIMPVLILKNYSRPIFFHVRDYLPSSRILKLLFKLSYQKELDLHFIANSRSVEAHIIKSYDIPEDKVSVCYNICEVSCPQKESQSIKKIGLSSMLAPWKGIHSILIFAKIYEKELRAIGIEEISIYGDNIYSTLGESSHYPHELHKLKEKLNISLISFKGKQSPSEIYSSIDLLIHPSLKLEPFGRILIEAYGHYLPVLSTGLGGSSELLVDKKLQSIDCLNYSDLFKKIKNLSLHNSQRAELIRDQYKHFELINHKAKKSIEDILC